MPGTIKKIAKLFTGFTYWMNVGPLRLRIFPRGWSWCVTSWGSPALGRMLCAGPLYIGWLTPHGRHVHDRGEAKNAGNLR